MISQYRHIIWDWNGTLFDDAWLCMEIINGVLAKRHLPLLDSARYQAQFTFPVKEYYRRVGFDFSRDSFETLAAEFVAEYDRRRFECTLQCEALPVLRALAARGVTQSILSAYEQRRLEEMAAFTGVQGHFTRLVGISDCYAGGKVAQGVRLIAELACDPADVVMIGDTRHDYEVATAMGIACVLIPSGHHGPAQLAQTGAPVRASLAHLLDGIA